MRAVLVRKVHVFWVGARRLGPAVTRGGWGKSWRRHILGPNRCLATGDWGARSHARGMRLRGRCGIRWAESMAVQVASKDCGRVSSLLLSCESLMISASWSGCVSIMVSVCLGSNVVDVEGWAGAEHLLVQYLRGLCCLFLMLLLLLCCTVVYLDVLWCTATCSDVLRCAVMCCGVLRCTAMYCGALCAVLCGATPPWRGVPRVVSCRVVLSEQSKGKCKQCNSPPRCHVPIRAKREPRIASPGPQRHLREVRLKLKMR